jgi:OOP family OmpA-OmpF porin
MKLKTLAATAAILCGTSGMAAAQSDSFSTLSPYVGIGAGQSDFDFSDRDWGLGVRTNDDTDTAWRVFAGVRLFQFIGAELGYIDFGETTGSSGASAEAQGIDLVALGALPLYQQGPHQFDIFATAGGYWWDADLKRAGFDNRLDGGDDFDYTYGAGVQYHFTNFGVRAEWQRYNNIFGEVDTDVWMGSVMFRF